MQILDPKPQSILAIIRSIQVIAAENERLDAISYEKVEGKFFMVPVEPCNRDRGDEAHEHG
jgi:hypothetical protein